MRAPMAGTARSTLYIAGRPLPLPGQAPPVLRHYVAPEHFRVMGIPLHRGRSFTSSDVAGAPRVRGGRGAGYSNGTGATG